MFSPTACRETQLSGARCRTPRLLQALKSVIDNALPRGLEPTDGVIERDLAKIHLVTKVLTQRVEIREGRIALVLQKQVFPFRINCGIVTVIF